MPRKYVRKTDRPPLSAEHRAKISAAIKQRYRENPEIKAGISGRSSTAMTAYHARAKAAIEALEVAEREQRGGGSGD